MLEKETVEAVHYWRVGRSYFSRQIYTTGFFLVDDLLIDCGPINTRQRLLALFRDLPVKRLAITHHHEDHTGNASILTQENGIVAFAHPSAAKSLDLISEEIPFYRRVVWGRPEPASFQPIPPEIITEHHALEVIHTPGHSDDHICLFERRNRWLFTGDLYLAGYLRYLRTDEDIYAIMDSLRRLIALKPNIVFCNHRGPVENGEEALVKKLAFLERLRDRALEAQQKGIPESQVEREFFRQDHFFRLFSLGEFSSRNLVKAFYHHRG